MPRPKTTQIDLLRTKAWAHTCARTIGEAEKASTYRLSIESSTFLEKKLDSIPEEERDTYPKSIDNGRWSRWLRGLRGVERKIVLALDNLCPGTANVYDIGPEAGPWIKECGADVDESQTHLYNKHLNQSANIPLWAAMSGKPDEILQAWKNDIPRRMWISWTPGKLRLTDAWVEWEQYEDPGDEDLGEEAELSNREIDYSEGDAIGDRAEFGKRIKRPKQLIRYSPDKWSWWKPNKKHFSSYEALESFLWDYIDGPTSTPIGPDTHPLLSFAAMLSVNSADYDSFGWRFRSYLKDSLAPYGLSMEEIITTTSTVVN